MKNMNFVFLLLFYLLFASYVNALETSSFRNRSTAGLLDDDLDKWTSTASGLFRDPAGLTGLEGYRIYTNLSNLVSHDEQFLDENQKSNYFLLGSSVPLNNLGHIGVMVNLHSIQQPLDTGMEYSDGEPILGEGESSESEFYDLDYNGSYDEKETLEKTVKSFEKSQNINALLSWGKNFSTFKLGFYYEYYLDEMQTRPFTDPLNTLGNTFSLEHSTVNLFNDQVTSKSQMSGSGSVLSRIDAHSLGFSFWKNTTQYDFGLFGALHYYSVSDRSIAQQSLLIDTSPGSEEIDVERGYQKFNALFPYSGIGFDLGVAATKNWSENLLTDVNLGYKHRSEDLSDNAGISYQLLEKTETTLGDNLRTSEINNQDNSDLSGPFTDHLIDFYSRSIARLNDRVIFAMGFGIGLYKSDQKTSVESKSENQESYNDGDQQPEDHDDYTKTTSTSQNYRWDSSMAFLECRLPVGVEFHVTDKLVFRLGAEYQYSDIGFTNSRNTLHASPLFQSTEYGDGLVNDHLMKDSFYLDNGLREYNDARMSRTQYFYSAGYEISENLQIDLMGFSQLTNLDAWLLSIVVKL